MKIGAFARKYGINTSVVRFYVDKALLTPRRENGQYIFDSICEGEMEEILKYKKYRFSLKEIERLLYYQSLSNSKDDRIYEKIIELLTQKRDFAEEEIDALYSIKESIEEEIDHFKALMSKPAEYVDAYAPLSAFNIMCCPDCGRSLRLEKALVEAEGIKEAFVKCDCGYSVTIEDGILLCPERTEESALRLFEGADVIMDSSNVGSQYRELIARGQLQMYQQIHRNCRSCRNVLVGPLTTDFILWNRNYISKEATVVVVEPSVNDILTMRKYLSNLNNNILFIAGDINRLPIRKGVMDLYIDAFSFNNCAVAYSMNLFQRITPFLKEGGKIIGHVADYSKAAKSLMDIKTDYPSFEPNQLTLKKTQACIADAGLKLTEKTILGASEDREKAFPHQVGSEKVSLIAYVAEK